MKILICDDDKNIIEEIRELILRFQESTDLPLEIDTYTEGLKAMKSNTNYDLAFVDVELSDTTGLEVTKVLKNINPSIIVFIVTSYGGYLDDAMDLSVFRYISKPIDCDRFARGLESAIKLYKESVEQILLYNADKCQSILTSDILYLTIEGRKTKIVTACREYISRHKLDYYKKSFAPKGYFAETHYSYLINLKYVLKFDKTSVTLLSENKETVLPISRGHYQSFKKAFYNFAGGMR